MAKDKDETLVLSKELIKELNKNQKEKVAWNLSRDQDNPTDVKDWVSTGSTILDYEIGNARDRGIPAGKITEIVGEEATGKSLMMMQILANVQRKGGLAVLIDEENALNPDFAKRVGLDLDKLVYLQCGCVERVGENIEKIITLAAAKDVKQMVAIGWDSVASTPPEVELNGDYDPNSLMGVQAKAIAKMMRKLTKMVGRERITMVFTNQLKYKIGVMFGDPMYTPGGKAIPYHASVRIRLTRSKQLEDGVKQVYGIRTLVKVFKNRLGPPMRKCEFNILFADGIDDSTSILDYLLDRGQDVERRMGKAVFKAIDKDVGKKMGDDKLGTWKDGELKIDPEDFKKYYETVTGFKNHVQELLDKYLIVSFDEIPADAEMDEESLLDAETVAEEAVA